MVAADLTGTMNEGQARALGDDVLAEYDIIRLPGGHLVHVRHRFEHGALVTPYEERQEFLLVNTALEPLCLHDCFLWQRHIDGDPEKPERTKKAIIRPSGIFRFRPSGSKVRAATMDEIFRAYVERSIVYHAARTRDFSGHEKMEAYRIILEITAQAECGMPPLMEMRRPGKTAA